MNKPIILFRADGDSQIGLGHLIRSSAISLILKENYDCILATRCTIQSLIDDLKESFSDIIYLPAQDFLTEARRLSDLIPIHTLIVLDGYSFGSEYQVILSRAGFDLFSIDDIHSFKFYSKVIINHSGGISPLQYKSFPHTLYYLGPGYSLLRGHFINAATNRRQQLTDNTCLICFGGADPGNKTLQVLHEYKLSKKFDSIHVVVGSGYKYLNELKSFATGKNVSIHYSLTSEEMVSVMRMCSTAILSPSSVVYEYMSIGGLVFLEEIADNQKDILNFFTNNSMAFPLDEIFNINTYQINTALEKQAFYFDGLSHTRLNKIFERYFIGKEWTIRKVGIYDLETCFRWANDPEVRSQSYNKNYITLQEHSEWFNRKLSDQDCFFYIIESNGQPVAQIRFQLSGNEAVLGYLADSAIRKKGVGTSILTKGLEAFAGDYFDTIKISAFVKTSNFASQKTFEKLSFIKEIATEYPNSFKYSMYINVSEKQNNQSIGLLCSGSLGEKALKHLHNKSKINFIFTDKKSTSIIEYCKRNSIRFFAGNPRMEIAKDFISTCKCDILLSVNYLFIINQDLIDTAAKYAINLHGSLLPKYRGRTPHVWAIINGEEETGITAHLMNTHVDSGGIIKKKKISISDFDTGYSLLEKFYHLYPIIIDEIIYEIELDKVSVLEQDHSKATYFRKRTPEDGEIEWSWTRKRIYNWVRAQSFPYPGAFTFYNNTKITINQVAILEFPYDSNIPDGFIMETIPKLLVKTSDGILELQSFKSEIEINIEKGKLFTCRTSQLTIN